MNSQPNQATNRTPTDIPRKTPLPPKRGRNAILENGVYTCEIVGARRKVREDIPDYASLDLTVIEEADYGKQVTATCFAYERQSNVPRRQGLGMLGTMAESDSALTNLIGVQVAASLVKRPTGAFFIYETQIMEVLNRPFTPCAPGLAWNPPPGVYRLRCLYQLGAKPPSSRIDFEVIEGKYRGFRLARGAEHLAVDEIQGYLTRFGFGEFDESGYCTSTPRHEVAYTVNNPPWRKDSIAGFTLVPEA